MMLCTGSHGKRCMQAMPHEASMESKRQALQDEMMNGEKSQFKNHEAAWSMHEECTRQPLHGRDEGPHANGSASHRVELALARSDGEVPPILL